MSFPLDLPCPEIDVRTDSVAWLASYDNRFQAGIPEFQLKRRMQIQQWVMMNKVVVILQATRFILPLHLSQMSNIF